MTTIQSRLLLPAAIAILTFAGASSAQDKTSGLLNTVEMRQLIARAEPADHARLAVHFGALADRYEAEARRHTSMSQSSMGNLSRNIGLDLSAHYKRLADLNAQSAVALRELVTYHQKLAVGVPSTPPRAGAQFEAGTGARAPTAQELNALETNARTPADHRALAEYFLTLAKRYADDANDHVAMAQAYRGTRIAQAADHCDRLVKLFRDSAKEATKSAVRHKELAGVVR